MIGIILQKLLCKFHQDPTSQTLSRLHLSSKSLPGVLEDALLIIFAWFWWHSTQDSKTKLI